MNFQLWSTFHLSLTIFRVLPRDGQRDGTERDGIQFSRPVPGGDGMGMRI